MERHYGLDWLRISAFGLLIFYHIGLVFVPWNFHVQIAQPMDWATIPLFLTNPWRLLLLFVISGFASRAALDRPSPDIGGFARSRTVRLMLPLLFGIVVIIPLQPWIELTSKHGYPYDFAYFWTHDYFRFGTLDGIILPNWQHLWFVVYLWVYTMLLAGAAWMLPRINLQGLFDRIFGGPGVLLVPLAWTLVCDLLLFRGHVDSQNLINDGAAHVRYLAGFLFGFGLARSAPAMAAIGRWWKWAALLAILSYAVIAVIDLIWLGNLAPAYDFGTLFHLARAVDRWAAIVALIGMANAWWNRDHPWRAMLTEAVFPFYIIHQTILVAVGGALIPTGIALPSLFAVLTATTIAGCWAFYLVGRKIGWLRPLIGLAPIRPVPPAGRAIPRRRGYAEAQAARG